jgi:hypothetical protein
MRLRWLLVVAAPLACGPMDPEPATPVAPPPPALAPAPPASSVAPPPAAAAAPTPPAGPAPTTNARAEEPLPAWITDVTTPLKSKLDACYAAGLAKAPTMVGTVLVSVGVDRDGKMTASPQTSETVPPAVVACVVGHLTRAKYAPPKGQAPIALSLPLHFHNNPTDGASVSVGRRDPGY